MRNLKLTLCAASLMLVAGCSSRAAVQCPPQTRPPAPPAWAMQAPSNSLTLLDETFSVSETESSEIRQH